MMIVMQTNMKEIPKSCILCPCCTWCPYPNRGGGQLYKKYKEERHEKCPLIEIDMEVEENV